MLEEIHQATIAGSCPLADTVGKAASYSVRTLRNREEVEEIRGIWQQWQNHPNSDIDFFLLLCRTRANVRRPHVIIVYNGTEPCAILAARLEDGHISPQIGYARPIRFAVRRLSVLYEGVLGHKDREVAKVLLDALQDSLSAGEADLVELSYVSEDSPLLRSSLSEVPGLWRDGKPAWSTHWELTLPEEVGGLLRKMRSKHRSWVNRKIRELDTAFPKQATYKSFSRGGDVDILCRQLEEVARLTYQRGLGEGFANDEEHQQRFALFHKRGLLRAWMLCVDDVPRAFCLGYVYGDTFYFSETGYDPALRDHEIGTLLFLYMTDELIKEGVAKFNFGFGDAYYKKRFGDRSWNEGTLRLYRRSVKGLAVRLCTGFFDATAAFGRNIIGRLGLLDKLKVAWRKRLSHHAKAKASEEQP